MPIPTPTFELALDDKLRRGVRHEGETSSPAGRGGLGRRDDRRVPGADPNPLVLRKRRWFFHERQFLDVQGGLWKWYCVCGEQSKRIFDSQEQARENCEEHRSHHPISQPARES